MAKKASTFLNMTITLLLITAVAGVSLGYINDITKGPIEQAKLERTTNALKNILDDFNNSPIEDVKYLKQDGATDSIAVYPALKDDQNIGTAVEGSSDKGYNGLIKILVGFNPDGTIRDIEVLEQKETPGLGTKIKGEKFRKQFWGKHPASFDLRVKKDQGEVDALTGATITTRAYTEAVEEAYKAFEESQKDQ